MPTSIHGRLVLSFSLLLALLLAVSAVAWRYVGTLTAGVHELVDHHARLSFLSQRVNQHAQEAALQLLRLLQTPTREQRVSLYLRMDEALAASDAALGGLERAIVGDAGDVGLHRIVDLRRRYGESFQATVEAIEIDGLAAARRHFGERTDELLKELLGATQAVANERQERMQTELDRLRAVAHRTQVVIGILALAALMAGGVLAMLIARGIARSVGQAVGCAESIAGGDYRCEIPASPIREMGVLMRALETMRESIASRERHILKLAYVDVLTELPNRTRFMEVLEESIGRGAGALILLDLDRFAPINNALGHHVGDRMLQDLARRLRDAAGGVHFVARLGADQFAIVMDNIDKDATAVFAQRVLDALRAPVLLDGQRLDIDASLGIVLYPQDGNDITALLRRADQAMSLAKRRHDGYVFAADLADAPPHAQLALVGEMREALAREEFTVFFQPKLALASGRIKGGEALLRWRHPERGLMPPGQFIPFAEQTGFIREITPWLLRTVIAQASVWHRQGLDIVVSANLSTLDLQSAELVRHVRTLLDAAGLPPARLCLEITESALMDDPDTALDYLRQLADLGVRLSIDDYGAGQASLAYVKDLPVHELKIDRAFVDRVDRLPRNAAIVRSTILLCRELGLSVVAEGAETRDEMNWLAQNGCEIVQGYGVAKPMPAADFADWVAAFGCNVPTPAMDN